MSKLSIHKLTQGNLTRIMPKNELSFRPGQITEGKILKLFPNNKAQIQLGGQKMTAQLNASLTIGEKYFFQVQSTDDVIHLKVLGEEKHRQLRMNAGALLEHLGFKQSKSNMALMEQLLQRKIPFDNQQLRQASRLLGGKQNFLSEKVLALTEMIASKWPVTDRVFQAVYAKNTSGLSERMNMVNAGNEGSIPHQKELSRQIDQLTSIPRTMKGNLVNQIISEVSSNKQQLFHLLSATGNVKDSIDFPTWKSEWLAIQIQAKQTPLKPINVLSSESNTLPFELDTAKVFHTLEQMVKHKNEITSAANQMLKDWHRPLSQAAEKLPLPNELENQIRLQTERMLLPMLTAGGGEQPANPRLQMQQLNEFLQLLQKQETYTQIEQFLTKIKSDAGFSASAPREQFLTQLNRTLSMLGLNYENRLASGNLNELPNTMKGTMLQILTQGAEGEFTKRTQELLHLLNGLQLQSVKESAELVQASIQLPAEKLGLNDDIDLLFQGKKSEEGTIDTDYCRILFHLNLKNIKETIIDMNVKKRSVAVTVFNDAKGLEDNSLSLKPLLKQGLESLNYRLASVSFKPLAHQAEEKVEINNSGTFLNEFQGVDYRI